MLGYSVHLTWTSDDGTVHLVGSWQSHSSISGSYENAWRERVWTGLVAESGIVSAVGSAYPTRYRIQPDALVRMLLSDRADAVWQHTLARSPIDTAQFIESLTMMPPGALVDAEEWDES